MLIIGFFVWMQRRAAGPDGQRHVDRAQPGQGLHADKPSTTFADIAGYEGVKQEITEVVDFLRMPERFKEIGARVPEGHPARRPARHRQDAVRPRRRR